MKFVPGVVGVMLFLLVVGAPRTVAADELPGDAYYIFKKGPCLTVWCDLSTTLNAKSVKQLKEGIDLAVEGRFNLSIPRRIFGNHQVAQLSFLHRLSYRALTGEYHMIDLQDSTRPELSFLSLAGLYQYLRDSVELCLVMIDSLNDEDQYELSLKITTVSLTDFNSVQGESGEGSSESPLGFLFRQFLDLTSYGRQEYETKSRAFTLDELDTAP